MSSVMNLRNDEMKVQPKRLNKQVYYSINVSKITLHETKYMQSHLLTCVDPKNEGGRVGKTETDTEVEM